MWTGPSWQIYSEAGASRYSLMSTTMLRPGRWEDRLKRAPRAVKFIDDGRTGTAGALFRVGALCAKKPSNGHVTEQPGAIGVFSNATGWPCSSSTTTSSAGPCGSKRGAACDSFRGRHIRVAHLTGARYPTITADSTG